MSAGSDFVGSGWAFPVRADATGGIALVNGEREIEDSIRLILGTSPGERPMRPEFGCAIHDVVFAPDSATTVGAVALEVRRALERWEPRIHLHGVDVAPDADEPSRLLIDVLYSIRETNDPRNLVVPFYVIPAEESRAATELPPAEAANVGSA
jgi:phage baseplate assembly protein W